MTRVLWLAVLVCVVQCLPMSQDELEDFSNFLLKTSSLDIHVKSTYLLASLMFPPTNYDGVWFLLSAYQKAIVIKASLSSRC